MRKTGGEVLSTTLTTVLVIDDNNEDLKYWCEALRNSADNYTVLGALNGQSGLELCRSQRIDCVVLELDMPESGFYVLFDLIRDRTRPQMAVVILTHLPYPYLLEMAKHNGAENAVQNAVAAVRSKDLTRAQFPPQRCTS